MSEENFLGDAQKEICSYYTATNEFFEQLPNCLTTLKKQLILDQASVNTRFVLLCLGSLSAAAITSRFQPSFIKVTRNTVLTYIGAGLFIVPEVFNPYLIYRK